MAEAARSPAEVPTAHTKAPRPRAVWGLVAALALLVPFSAPAGWSLVVDPSGASIGVPASYRDLVPLPDLLLVGLFLLAFYTVAPVIIVFGLVTRREFPVARAVSQRVGLHWSWFAAVTLAVVIIGWIVTEMFLFASAPSPIMTGLWLICLGLAGVIIFSASPRQVRVHYRVERRSAPRARSTPS